MSQTAREQAAAFSRRSGFTGHLGAGAQLI
jgi:hypothetical protein